MTLCRLIMIALREEGDSPLGWGNFLIEWFPVNDLSFGPWSFQFGSHFLGVEVNSVA